MSKEQLKLTGIQRNRKLRKFDPGSCNELINLRFHEGVWKAVGDKVADRKIYGYNIKKMLTYHTIGSIGNFIYLTDTGQIRSNSASINDGGDPAAASYATLISGLDPEQEYRAESLNNVLVILTQDKMYHFVWKNGAYIAGVSSFPDFSIKRVIGDVVTDWSLLRENYYDLGNRLIISELIGDGTSGGNVDFTTNLKSRLVNGIIPDFETLLASMQSRKNLAQENGIPVGPVYMCATIEFFDGSEIQHTPPVATTFGELIAAKKTPTSAADVSVRISEYTPNQSPSVEDLKFKFLISGIVDKTLVKRVHFYITRPPRVLSEYWDESMSFVKPIVTPWGVYHKGGPELWRAYQPIYVTEGLAKHQFFRIGSADIEDLPEDGIVSVKFNNVNNLESYEALPIDNYTHHSIASKSIAQYNGRVILANITTKLRKPGKFSNMGLRTGHKPVTIGGSQAVIDWYLQRIQLQGSSAPVENNPDWPFIVRSWEDNVTYGGGHMVQGYLEAGGGVAAASLGYFSGSMLGVGGWRPSNQYKVKTEVFYRVWIKGETGEVVVTSETEMIETFTMEWNPTESKWRLMFLLVGTATYPDVRASKIEIYIKGVSWQHVGITGEMPFQPNSKPFWKISKAMVPSEFNNFALCSLDEKLSYTMSNANAPAADLPPLIHDVNRVQASLLNNPFVFPAINSYRVGTSEVVGLQTINNELSEGQFGEFPMIAFTNSGIWAMKIGTGEMFVSAVVPLANEICTNPASITAIRKGIMFVTNEGLKILQGSQVQNISEDAQGLPGNDVRTGSVFREVVAASKYETSKIVNNHVIRTVGYTPILSDIDFKDYIQTAQIGYDDYYEEIIVSSPDKDYSYVFSITQRAWRKTDWRFSGFSCKFPYLFAYKNNTGFSSEHSVMLTNKETRGKKDVLLLTNSFGFSNSFAKFEQMMIRGKLGSSRALVFGSTDQSKWHLLSIMTTAGGYDMKLPRGFYTCKYFVLFIDGKWEPDSYLEEIDAEVKVRYQQKFR